MAIVSSWIHGNALKIQTPTQYRNNDLLGELRLTSTHEGAFITALGQGINSWMHLPIPTIKEQLKWGELFKLRSVVLLFATTVARIQTVQVFDGGQMLQSFDNLGRSGIFYTPSRANTFELTPPRLVSTGIGLSFHFMPDVALDASGEAGLRTLFVTAAGANFETVSSIYGQSSYPPPKGFGGFGG